VKIEKSWFEASPGKVSIRPYLKKKLSAKWDYVYSSTIYMAQTLTSINPLYYRERKRGREPKVFLFSIIYLN
jgi:hypothetical protein